jgi:hypothetical protein
MMRLNNISAAENDIEHIRGTLNQWQRVSRGNWALLISLIMMLYYVLCEAVRDPHEEEGKFGGPEYGTVLLSMLFIAASFDFVVSRDKREILQKYDAMNTKLLKVDDEQFVGFEQDISQDLAWIDSQESNQSLIDKSIRPLLFTANAVTAYSIAGEPGLTLASSIMLSIKLNERHEEKAIVPRTGPK